MSRRRSVSSVSDEHKYTGVKVVHTKLGTHYDARITHEGKARVLGSFETEEEAARAYDREKIRLKGRTDIKLNFPASDYEDEKAPKKAAGQRLSLPAAATSKAKGSRRKSAAASFLSPEVKTAAKVPIVDGDSPAPRDGRPRPVGGVEAANETDAGYFWVVVLLLAMLVGAISFPTAVPQHLRAPFVALRPHFVRGFAPVVQASEDITSRLMQIHAGHSGLGSVSDVAPGSLCARSVDADAMAKMVDKGEVWQRWAREAADAIARQGDGAAAAEAPKALAVLLPSPAPGPRVAKSLAAPFAACREDGCLLEVAGGDYAANFDDPAAVPDPWKDAKGRLQKDLTEFLARCPRGVVLMTDVQDLPKWVATALLPLVSEQGQYMRDGTGVQAWRATVVIHMHLPDGIPAEWLADEGALARGAKGAFEALFGTEADGEEMAALARGLRRRIDLVGLLRKKSAKKGVSGRTPGMA